MRLLRDDAGIVYFNGTEVLRSPNMPAGVAYNAFTGGSPRQTTPWTPPTSSIPATSSQRPEPLSLARFTNRPRHRRTLALTLNCWACRLPWHPLFTAPVSAPTLFSTGTIQHSCSNPLACSPVDGCPFSPPSALMQSSRQAIRNSSGSESPERRIQSTSSPMDWTLVWTRPNRRKLHRINGLPA